MFKGLMHADSPNAADAQLWDCFVTFHDPEGSVLASSDGSNYTLRGTAGRPGSESNIRMTQSGFRVALYALTGRKPDKVRLFVAKAHAADAPYPLMDAFIWLYTSGRCGQFIR